MPTVNPAFSPVQVQGQDVHRLYWSGVITGDTIVSFGVPTGVVGSVQIDGTFGGATAALQISNDNTTFFTMRDPNNTLISATAAGYFEFESTGVYLRPNVTGGAANSINFKVVLRRR